MKKKLTVILGMFGMFVLGCATASVLVDQASATPPAGSTQCVSFGVHHLSQNDVAKGKTEEKVATLPPGWTPVGGASFGEFPSVIACRTTG
jgi:outer membrane lipoprotein SlyB